MHHKTNIEVKIEDIHSALSAGSSQKVMNAPKEVIKNRWRVSLSHFGELIAVVDNVEYLHRLTSLDGEMDHLRTKNS